MIKQADKPSLLSQIFHYVFRSYNPFTSAGQLNMPVRIVLYPTYGYYLNSEQFQALTSTLNDCGEQEFFISEVEAEPDPFVTSYHWVCKSPSFSEYMNLSLSTENALYSANGLWGILVSHEDHALLVCQPNFARFFQAHYSHWKQDLEKFVQNWQQNEKELGSDIRWLEEFLNHLSPPIE